MKPKSQYFFVIAIILSLLLGSCSPAPVINTLVPTAALPGIVATPTNTPVIIVQPSPSPDVPSPTATTESISVPSITLQECANFNWETSWVPVSSDQYVALQGAAPTSEIIVTDTVPPVKVINAGVAFGTTSLEISGVLRRNLFLQRAVAIDVISGKPYHVLMWKAIALGSDGHNHLVNINTSFDLTPGSEPQEDEMHKLATASGVLLMIIVDDTTIFRGGPNEFWKPIIGSNTVRTNLMNGIIDENTGSELLWLIRFTTFSPNN